jgi:hypothetical protein
MVACVSRIATAILALEARQYVSGKSESIRLYRLHVGDAWSGYLETLYEHLKQKWHYLIPTEETERRLLRQLCEQTLAFESHFLALYDVYLSGLTDSSSEDDRTYAATQLQRLRR